MNEKKEFEPLDNLFRQTFEELPPVASPTGWDKPSPRVWEQVQAQISPHAGGWSKTHSLLTAAGIVLLVAAAAFYWSRSNHAAPVQDNPIPAAPAEKPVQIAPAPGEARPYVNTAPVVAPEETGTAAKKRPDGTASRPQTKPAASESSSDTPDNGQAKPLPGAGKRISPNTTEQRRDEGAPPRHKPDGE